MLKTAQKQSEATRFSFSMPIMKCYEEVHLDEDGKEKKEKFIEGVASSTDIDLHGDKMAPSAIKSMANSIKKHIIGLNAEHDKSWQSELGDVTKLSVDTKNHLVMKAKLDITSKAKDLWYALTEKKKELGLSIGGFVKDYKLEWDKKKEVFSRVYKDIELDHIAVTSTPANPKTWVGAIAKSMDKAERLEAVSTFSDMTREELIKFINLSMKTLGDENIVKLLTNFSLKVNDSTLMNKKKQSSLESEDAKKKVSTEAENDEAKKDASELEDEKGTKEAESENQENEDKKAVDDSDEKTDEEESSEEEDSDSEDDSKDESAEDNSKASDEESDSEESEEDSEEEDSEDEEEDDSEEDEEDEEDEEKSLTRKEVGNMIQEGFEKGLKGFFGKLLGKDGSQPKKTEENKDEKVEGEEDKDTEKSAADLLKSVITNQEKMAKMLKKNRVVNRKTTKGIAVDKDESEGDDNTDVYKSLDEELDAIRKANENDPERAFSECGRIRLKWASKEK